MHGALDRNVPSLCTIKRVRSKHTIANQSIKLTTVASKFCKCFPTFRRRTSQIDVRLEAGNSCTRAGILHFGVIAVVPKLWRGILGLCEEVSIYLDISMEQHQNCADLLPHGMFPLCCSAKDLDTVCAPISAASSRALIPFVSKSLIKES